MNMKKVVSVFLFLLITAGLFAQVSEGQGTGLEKTPDKLKRALPQAQPNGLVTAPEARPGDGKSVESMPSSVDLSRWLPPIDTQGSIGSCSAWSTIYYSKTLQENMERGWGADENWEIFSPLYTYNQITNGVNQGTAIVDHMAIVVEQGCATFATFPEKYDLTARPNSTSQSEAAKYKASSYESLDSYNYDTDSWEVSLDRIKTLLADGFPVVVGFDVYNDFYDYSGGVYSRTSGGFSGGHAMCIVGYDDSQRTLKIVNSWGDWWGDNGFLYLHYNLFEEIANWGAGVLYDHTEQKEEMVFAPTGVEATRGTYEESIKITWATVEGSKEYAVFRSNNADATLEEIGRTADSVYFDDPLPPGVTYIYAVKAVTNSGKMSDFSPIAEGSTKEASRYSTPGTPANLEYFYKRGMSLIFWDAVDDCKGYTVYRWSDSQENWISYGNSSDNYFIDPEIDTYERDSSTAWYIVSAYNDYGEGSASTAISIPLNGVSSGNPALASKMQRGSRDDSRNKYSRDTYDGEFHETDYFDYEYTMKQFREFYEAEQKAFREWQRKEQDAFQEYLKSQRNY